jgi:hypothetical protein
MTNNKQQTAVDILCGKLAMKLGIPQAITFYIDHQEEIREAKEMEKVKAFEIFKAGQDSMEEGGKGFEQWYEQRYGGNK